MADPKTQVKCPFCKASIPPRITVQDQQENWIRFCLNCDKWVQVKTPIKQGPQAL
jgi:transcription elongation factor Elf1